MTVALALLAFALLVALLYVHWANGRERQELLSAHAKDRADLLDRLHTTAADQVAAVVRSFPPPAEKPADPPDFVFPLDDDLRLLEPID